MYDKNPPENGGFVSNLNPRNFRFGDFFKMQSKYYKPQEDTLLEFF